MAAKKTKVKKDVKDNVIPEGPKPKVGSEIYVQTQIYIDHGEDDIMGGLGTITKVYTISASDSWFIEVKEVPNRGWNYSVLMEQQDYLKQEFGKKRARPDPCP
jgi:hypothetical protein